MVLAVLTRETRVAVAFVGSGSVDTASVDARASSTLVDVLGTGSTRKSRSTCAAIRIGQRLALGAVLTRMQSAVINSLALGTTESRWTGARVVVERAKDTGAAVLTRCNVTCIRHRNLTE